MPVLIAEVADTSPEYDRATKASVYAQASVEDYWVVNLMDENVEVYRGPSAMPHQPTGHGYRSKVIYMRGETIAPLAEPEGAVTVDDLLP